MATRLVVHPLYPIEAHELKGECLWLPPVVPGRREPVTDSCGVSTAQGTGDAVPDVSSARRPCCRVDERIYIRGVGEGGRRGGDRALPRARPGRCSRQRSPRRGDRPTGEAGPRRIRRPGRALGSRGRRDPRHPAAARHSRRAHGLGIPVDRTGGCGPRFPRPRRGTCMGPALAGRRCPGVGVLGSRRCAEVPGRRARLAAGGAARHGHRGRGRCRARRRAPAIPGVLGATPSTPPVPSRPAVRWWCCRSTGTRPPGRWRRSSSGRACAFLLAGVAGCCPTQTPGRPHGSFRCVTAGSGDSDPETTPSVNRSNQMTDSSAHAGGSPEGPALTRPAGEAQLVAKRVRDGPPVVGQAGGVRLQRGEQLRSSAQRRAASGRASLGGDHTPRLQHPVPQEQGLDLVVAASRVGSAPTSQQPFPVVQLSPVGDSSTRSAQSTRELDRGHCPPSRCGVAQAHREEERHRPTLRGSPATTSSVLRSTS